MKNQFFLRISFSDTIMKKLYSKTPHKRTGILGVQADFVLIHLQNQPENVLKVFLN